MRHFFIPIFFFFISCQNNSGKSDQSALDSGNQTVLTDSLATDLEYDILNSSGVTPTIWLVDIDKKTKTKNPNFQEEYLNIDTLINALNQKHPNIILEKIKISGDTLFTEIKDSEYLGERIGSYGASAYIADVVINLTSVKNINFIQIDMEYGSHISPETLSKKDYSNYKEVQ